MQTDKLPDFVRKILAARRKSRAAFFLSKVDVSDNMRVIDIGCGIDGRSFEDFIPQDWQITGVDILPESSIRHKHPNFSYRRMDAQDLSCYRDLEFDLAISVGMLEHITEQSQFNNIVSELRRVARQHIVVVPYRYCWVEPHYGVPFFPLLPYSMKVALVKTFNLSNHRRALSRDRQYINKFCRWLSNEEYEREFPDSKIFLTPTLETIAIVRAA